jgi:predicted membrane chloride channel (bestrophin family)
MSLFTEDIKNTRFFLTLVIVAGIFILMAIDAVIIALKVPVDTAAFGLLNIVLGVFATQVTTCYKSYFEDRAEIDKLKFAPTIIAESIKEPLPT